MPCGPRQNRQGCHGYPACYAATSDCPACSGMGVQLAVESLSSFAWNRCPACSGMGVQLAVEYARMVAQPRLFIQSLRAQEEQRANTRLAQGPEGQFAADVRQLLALIKRLRQRLPTLRREMLSESLPGALTHLRTAVDALQSELTRSEDHDPQLDPRCGPNPASPRQEPARNQPCAATLS